jgi:hypothetical protein
VNLSFLGAVAISPLAAASACFDTSPAETWASAETHEISRAAAWANATVPVCNPAGEQARNSLAEAAAASRDAPPVLAPEGTGISGRAVIWPSCPAESGQPECAPKPLAARIVVLRSAGQRVATLDAGIDGWFQVAVAPGAYVIEAEADSMLCAPVNVTVPGYGYANVEVRCDTGIR